MSASPNKAEGAQLRAEKCSCLCQRIRESIAGTSALAGEQWRRVQLQAQPDQRNQRLVHSFVEETGQEAAAENPEEVVRLEDAARIVVLLLILATPASAHSEFGTMRWEGTCVGKKLLQEYIRFSIATPKSGFLLCNCAVLWPTLTFAFGLRLKGSVKLARFDQI